MSPNLINVNVPTDIFSSMPWCLLLEPDIRRSCRKKDPKGEFVRCMFFLEGITNKQALLAYWRKFDKSDRYLII